MSISKARKYRGAFNLRGNKGFLVIQKNNLKLYRVSTDLVVIFAVVHPDNTILEFSHPDPQIGGQQAMDYIANNHDYINKNSGQRFERRGEYITLTYGEILYLIDIIPDRIRWRHLLNKLMKARERSDVKFTRSNLRTTNNNAPDNIHNGDDTKQ